MRRSAALIALTVALSACGSPRVSLTGEPKYGKTAEEDYQAGVEEAKAERWADATKFLDHVRSKYPFSKFATLAELKLADVKLGQDRLQEAADAFAAFQKMHPTHEQADYAAWREAQALFKDAPSDFFLFPPAYERELKSLRESAARLEAFGAKYPQSKYRGDVEKLLGQARAVLAEHEWYAGNFYAQRRRWAGAAGRYEALVKKYPGSKREVDALFALADASRHLDDRFRARQALQQIIVKHPDDKRRAEAEKLLAELR